MKKTDIKVITSEKYEEVNVIGISDDGIAYSLKNEDVTDIILELAALILIEGDMTIKAFNRDIVMSAKVK